MSPRWTLHILFFMALGAGSAGTTGTAARARPLRVVLDPGHGGTNLGARGPGGLLEKRVTLRASRLLARALARHGVQVLRTRSTDRYLSLAARVRRANALGADLLVSLHCNASPKRDQRGYEAYVTPPDAVSPALESSRGSDRPSLLRSGQATRLALQRTLQDLRSRTRRRRSLALGRAVMSALRHTLGPARDRGLQQAAFDVLLGLKMPGILVEMGFLDHPIEGRLLARRAYLARVARAIAAGVLTFARETLGRDSAEKAVRLTTPGTPPPHRPKDRRHPTLEDTIWPRRLRPQVALEPAA